MKTTISLFFFVFCLFVSKAQFFPDTLTLCEDSVLIIEAPFSGVSYQWSNGSTDSSITVNSPGTYSLTITDSNAVQLVDSTYAKFQYLPIANFGVDWMSFTTVVFSDSSLYSDAYLWDFDDGDTSNLRNPVHIFPNFTDTPTCYKVQLIARNGCGADSMRKDVWLDFDGNVNELSSTSLQNLLVFPNPSNQFIWLNFRSTIPNGGLKIVSITGETVLAQDKLYLQNQLDLRHLPKGIYFLSVTDGNEKRVEKLILY